MPVKTHTHAFIGLLPVNPSSPSYCPGPSKGKQSPYARLQPTDTNLPACCQYTTHHTCHTCCLDSVLGRNNSPLLGHNPNTPDANVSLCYGTLTCLLSAPPQSELLLLREVLKAALSSNQAAIGSSMLQEQAKKVETIVQVSHAGLQVINSILT